MEDGTPEIVQSRMLAEALGRVVQEAATLEVVLRTLAAALIGSKYAAVVVAGQSTSSLVATIEAVSKVHDQVGPERREELKRMLSNVKGSIKQRNNFVHGMWAKAADGAVTAHTSRYREIHWNKTPVRLAELTELSDELQSQAGDLLAWTMDALPAGAVQHEAQLRWEAYLKSLTPDEAAALVERRSRSAE